jgi:HK97 gp10 family phage protein
MKNVESLFKFSPDSLSKIANTIGKQPARYDAIMKKRMTSAVQIVWSVAHSKRPMISKIQMKQQGRTKRVSEAGAEAGVPVDTGALQASILKEVKPGKELGSWVGRIYTKGIPYAGYMEYGTSRIKARPFMRPAVALTASSLKQVFGVPAANQ